MKRQLLTSLIAFLCISTIAQQANIKPSMRDKSAPMVKAKTEILEVDCKKTPVNITSPKSFLFEEEAMGLTRFDLQTNRSMQNRIYKFYDGTIGGVFTYGINDPGFTDRGTGYNYYDGNLWGPYPTDRIETSRTGWPSYAPFGENGEIICAHYSGAATDGLAFSYRNEKGTGYWAHFNFIGPAGHEGLLWPRMTTGGINHSIIHMIPITRPTQNGGAIYEGVDGAIVYSRSTDGGVTWNPENLLLDEINADFYLAINGDTYEIQAQGDNVAFLFGEPFIDLTLMKSTDGGDSWAKTVIWECPYPLFDPNNMITTDTFYCVDGAHALSFGPDGKVHVAFGINKAYSDGSAIFWFPLVNGLGYWNESRTTFSNDKNALNPYYHPNSEMIIDYNLIGYELDIDGNGTWDILGEPGIYYVGASSMPGIIVDGQNQVFVVYSSIVEGFDNGVQDYRHLWGRASTNGGDWWGHFVDLNADIVHIFDECVFPSISQASDEYVYINYMMDSEPGLADGGDDCPYGDNMIQFMKIDKNDLLSGVFEQKAVHNIDVSQNQPNPFSRTSAVKVNVRHATELSLEVSNIMGQIVYSCDAGRVLPGITRFIIDGSQLSRGIYVYTVKAYDASVTKKMVVE